MLINIGDHEFTECWDGVLYKSLSHYPDITEWEIQSILDFIKYEESHGRNCDIIADEQILIKIDAFNKSGKGRIPVPDKLTECTACPTYKGCMTDFVCHTSPIENALKILDCGSLLSPVRARNMPADILKKEKRNAANDPEDYFQYIMFAWGNCQAGDRLVVERRLGRAPTEAELGPGFEAGVRFYFRYDDIIRHPKAVFDGVLPLKVKDEVVLKDYVYGIIIPYVFKEAVKGHISKTKALRAVCIFSIKAIWIYGSGQRVHMNI